MERVIVLDGTEGLAPTIAYIGQAEKPAEVVDDRCACGANCESDGAGGRYCPACGANHLATPSVREDSISPEAEEPCPRRTLAPIDGGTPIDFEYGDDGKLPRQSVGRPAKTSAACDGKEAATRAAGCCSAPVSDRRMSAPPKKPTSQLFHDLYKAIGTTKKLAYELSTAKPSSVYRRLVDRLNEASKTLTAWEAEARAYIAEQRAKLDEERRALAASRRLSPDPELCVAVGE